MGKSMESDRQQRLPSYSAEKVSRNYPTRVDEDLLSGPYTPRYLATAVVSLLESRVGVLEAENDRLRARVGRMRRSLRQLNKAHGTLWKVVALATQKGGS